MFDARFELHIIQMMMSESRFDLEDPIQFVSPNHLSLLTSRFLFWWRCFLHRSCQLFTVWCQHNPLPKIFNTFQVPLVGPHLFHQPVVISEIISTIFIVDKDEDTPRPSHQTTPFPPHQPIQWGITGWKYLHVLYQCTFRQYTEGTSVADLERFDTDPDPYSTFLCRHGSGSGSEFYLLRKIMPPNLQLFVQNL